jgi:hypothetical protein
MMELKIMLEAIWSDLPQESIKQSTLGFREREREGERERERERERE